MCHLTMLSLLQRVTWVNSRTVRLHGATVVYFCVALSGGASGHLVLEQTV